MATPGAPGGDAGSSTGGEFVDGWLVAQVLGEGAYGEVRLLVHGSTGACVALKSVRAENEAGGTAREAALHRALRHRHVLRCLGARSQPPMHYMFLEYAQGGELFDRIEPDIAPEVLRAGERPYRAPPADLWAAALVLLAMLAGELPWERAHQTDARYALWVEDRGAGAARAPWSKLPRGARALLARALQPDPAKRHTLDQLLDHPWLTGATDSTPNHDIAVRTWSSQPIGGGERDEPDGADEDCAGPEGEALRMLVHSQPCAPRDLLLSQSATQHTQLTQGGVCSRLVRRMTRVWLRGDEAAALRALRTALHSLAMTARKLPGCAHQVAIECGDDVRMRAWAVRATPESGGGDEGLTLLEFRRSRGCGLAFKRRFLQLRAALAPVAAAPPAPPFADLLAPPLALSMSNTEGNSPPEPMEHD